MLTFLKDSPESVGIPSCCIKNCLDRLNRQGIPMHSFLLMRHDKLITEGYFSPCKADTLHRMFSISKSFTAVAMGLLTDEGKLSLNDPIAKYFPEKLPEKVHPWIAEMTIRDMLMMRTCHAAATYKFDMTKDWVESFFTTPPTHPAGKLFHYDTSSAHTLCALAEKLTGEEMLHYIKKKLSVLGFSENSYMLKDPFGVSMGGSGLVATSMDILKFGYFLYHNGCIEGKQLLSSSYIKEATSKLTETCVTAPIPSEAAGYGYQIWQNEKNGYVCYGMGGQLIIILPDYHMICVTTADTQGIGGGNQQIYNAIYEEILPYVQEEALPVNTGTRSEYLSIIKALQLSPLKGKSDSPIASSINKKLYKVCHTLKTPSADFSLSDKWGFESFSVSFDQQGQRSFGYTGGTLTFVLAGKTYHLSFGLQSMKTGLFPIYDMNYAASGAWLTDNTLYIKVHIIDSSVGSVHFQLTFGENDLTIFMRKQEETMFNEFNGHIYCEKGI